MAHGKGLAREAGPFCVVGIWLRNTHIAFIIARRGSGADLDTLVIAGQSMAGCVRCAVRQPVTSSIIRSR